MSWRRILVSPPSELVTGRRASPVQNLPQQPPIGICAVAKKSDPCLHGQLPDRLIIIIIIIIVLTSFFHASTGQTVFPPMRLFHLVLSCAHDAFRPCERRSYLTHSPHVFLPLPFFFCPATSKSLQADTQSCLSFRSR